MDTSRERVIANIGHHHNGGVVKLVAWDDVTGAVLDPDLVKEARNAAMVFFKKMNVYENVTESERYKETGKAPIGVRWIDVNKQDEKDTLTDPGWSPRTTTTPRALLISTRQV